MMIRTVLNGFCMALADSVPGVSGGTVALILGFYRDFIGTLHGLIYGSLEKKKIAFKYLVKLGIGWIVGMALAINVLTAFFEKSIYSVSSLFLSLVLCSVPVIIKEEWKNIKSKPVYLIFTALGLAVVLLLSFCNAPVLLLNGNLMHLNFFGAVYIFFSGALAVCAMFLPGISGSTVLLILGVYMPIMKTVKECLHFNFENITVVIVFAAGILTGSVLSIKGIKICLDRFRSQTVYLIIGMLIGSLYTIVIGTTACNADNQPLLPNHLSLPWFLSGVAIILAVQLMRYITERKNIKQLINKGKE